MPHNRVGPSSKPGFGVVTLFPDWIRGCQLGVLICAGLLLTTVVHADAIPLKSGKILRGTVVPGSFDGSSVEIELESGPKTRLPMRQLAASYQYRIRSKEPAPTSGQDHYRLARFCIDNQLLALARKHLDLAAKVDKKLRDKIELRMTELDEMAAEVLYRRVLSHAKGKRFREAVEDARSMIKKYSDSAAAGWTRKLLPSIQQALIAQTEAKRLEDQQKKNNKMTPTKRKALAKELEQERKRLRFREMAQTHLREGKKHYGEALKLEGKGAESEAAKKYKEASEEYDKAYKCAQSLRRLATHSQQVQLLLKWQQSIIHTWTLMAISAGHLRARQGNWKRSHHWLDLAIRLEPLNTDARRLHKEVGKRRRNYSAAKQGNHKPTVSSH